MRGKWPTCYLCIRDMSWVSEKAGRGGLLLSVASVGRLPFGSTIPPSLQACCYREDVLVFCAGGQASKIRSHALPADFAWSRNLIPKSGTRGVLIEARYWLPPNSGTTRKRTANSIDNSRQARFETETMGDRGTIHSGES